MAIMRTKGGSRLVADGTVMKALSGFYYVETDSGILRCRARGRMRYDKVTPLVGDRVTVTPTGGGEGALDAILPRKNQFFRPPAANIDLMVILAANVIPVTDPFLIDCMTAIAAHAGAGSLVVLNKCDLDRADGLFGIYSRAGVDVLRVSALTGEGTEELKARLRGRFSVFTGNSGVGKSSVLNAIAPDLSIPTGEVSQKLGRGRHTTRHVEIFRTPDGALIADTPGFSAFDMEKMELTDAGKLQYAFPEFAPYLDSCRFAGCSHVKESGCAVLEALREGKLEPTRHRSYVRLYEQLKSVNEWERRTTAK